MLTKMRLLAVAGSMMAAIVGISSSVQAANIDFETGAPAGFDETSPLTGAYASEGVTFSGVSGKGGSILNDISFSPIKAHSGRDFLAFNSLANTGLTERLTFSSAISTFSIYLAADGPTVFNAIGLDAHGATLASATVTSNGSQYANLSLSGFNFSQVLLSGSQRSPSFMQVFVADDLSFSGAATTSAVPETATWLMMILGFGAIGGIMRRAYRRSDERFTTKVRAVAAA